MTDASKHVGFLYSPAGQAALSKIREYFVNIGVWLAPPCFNNRFWFDIVWAERLVGAALTWPGQAIPERRLLLCSTWHILRPRRNRTSGRGLSKPSGSQGGCWTWWTWDLRPHIDLFWPSPRRQVDGDPPLP